MAEEAVEGTEGPKTVYGGFDAQLTLDGFGAEEQTPPEVEKVIIQPELPMSVALIGAPGTGKDETAREFLKLATPWLKEQDQNIILIKNVGAELEGAYDVAMGQFGGYRENLWGAFNRIERERITELTGSSYISVGTVLESLAHAGVNYELTMLGNESGIITPDTQGELQKIQLAMTLLTFLFVDTFRYKFAFYIPRTEPIIIPGQDETQEQRYARRVDNALREVFSNFQLRIQILDQKTNEERAKVAFETIKEIYESGIEVPASMAPPESVV